MRAFRIAIAAVMVVPVFTAFAAELPLRKPGLWEMKMGAQPPMPAMTMQHCTDAATDKAMSAGASPMAGDACAKNEVAKTSYGYTTDAICTIGGKTSTTHSEITGDFDSSYTVKVTSKIDGSSRNDTTTIEAKWLGACKPGQKPGDVVMPGGMKININDLNSARSKLK